jgi:MGT family glycosyltransferase
VSWRRTPRRQRVEDGASGTRLAEAIGRRRGRGANVSRVVARVVVACTPLQGHVTPLVALAGELVSRGHEVEVLTGARFAGAVGEVSARHRSLPAGADYDDRTLERAGGGRLRRVRADIRTLLADRLPAQHDALDVLVAELRPAAVVIDTSFLGGLAWKLAEPERRPPLAVLNITFLTLAGPGVPPAGVGLAPLAGRAGQARDAAVRAVTARALRAELAHLDRRCEQATGRVVPGLLFDAHGRAERLLVATVPSFEYHRPGLPAGVRFVGPVLPARPEPFDPPPWWADLGGGRPVVHVTQGTMDNADLGRLLAPTLAALADEDVTVVAVTGGRPVSALPGPLPRNSRVWPYLPYDRLLSAVDVMVTNGGYGGVQRALAAGVPLVVAGDGEDKPEVAARVAWSGVGINLRTGRPRPGRIRKAVRRVLDEPGFAARARGLAAEMARYDGRRLGADAVEELLGTRRATGS